VLYAFDLTGKHRGAVMLDGVWAIDWEDMCAFHRDGKNCLILADVGDNNATREFVTLYIVEEPRLTDRQIRLLQKIDYTYEGGPQNCEAVAYDPIEGEVILIAKTFDIQCRAFALKLPAVGAEGNRRLKAKLLGEITSPMVTALDISRDGKRAIVLTYKHAYDYVRKEGESWGQALAGRPQKIKLPHRKQGEAITYGTDGKTLYTTSEQLTAPLLMVPVR